MPYWAKPPTATAKMQGYDGTNWQNILVDGDQHLYTAPGYWSGSYGGTTTDSYTNALDWSDADKFLHKTILIKNTGDTNNMDYKVLVYVVDGGIAYEETSGTLAPGDVAKIVLNNWYSRVVVQVKSSTAGASTSYQVDAGGLKG